MRSKANMDKEPGTAAAIPDNQDTEISGLHSSKRSRKKALNSARVAGRSSSVSMQSGPSSGCLQAESRTKLPKPKIDLRALFDYHFTRKQHRFRKRWNLRETEPTPSLRRARKRPGRRRISEDEQRKRMKEGGLVFPFVKKYYGRKHLPLKTVREYEYAALKGFFQYIEMLKYEHHLKKSLTQLNAVGDLENECLESRRHKYLDDDGPISPIAETSNEDSGNEDIGAKIVDNSCFILRCKIPKKKKKSNLRRK